MKLTQVFKYVTRRYIVGNFFRSFVTPIFGDRWRFGSIKTQTQTKSFSSTDERLGSNNQPMKATKNQSALFEIAFPKIQAQQDIPNAYETLQFNKTTDGVATVTLNRPKQLNAFNILMWNEFMTAFQNVDKDKDAKCIILTGNEKSFSTGMDLSVFLDIDIVLNDEPCQGRRKEGLAKMIQFFQDSVSATEHCSVPVIAAASGFCIGGALDVFTACDLRYCTADARFSIKETDLAMVADIGTLQRLPGLIGTQQARELAYTGREFSGREAEALGLVLKCFDTHDDMMKQVQSVASGIAKKSPLAIRGIKSTLLYARDHGIKDSLEQVKMHNAAMLHSKDLSAAMTAYATKTKPSFSGH